MLKALLFDLDGTLIDSEHFHFECWNEILQEYSVQLTYNDWIKNYSGITLPANALSLIEKYNLNISLPELIEKRESLALELLKTKDIQLMPFVAETVKFFYERGLILAIVTASPRQDVDAMFQRNGFRDYFKLIITRSDVTKSKPDPESYNICREQLGLAKDECIVFEDTLNGIKSAKAAGLSCYAIQSNTEEHNKLELADKLFLNFREARDYLLQAEYL